jgi:SlyX protein
MSDKIVELEVKIAFLEQSITELSDVVYSQQQQIDSLKNDQHRMRTHLQSLDKDDQHVIDDQPPPHY